MSSGSLCVAAVGLSTLIVPLSGTMASALIAFAWTTAVTAPMVAPGADDVDAE